MMSDFSSISLARQKILNALTLKAENPVTEFDLYKVAFNKFYELALWDDDLYLAARLYEDNINTYISDIAHLKGVIRDEIRKNNDPDIINELKAFQQEVLQFEHIYFDKNFTYLQFKEGCINFLNAMDQYAFNLPSTIVSALESVLQSLIKIVRPADEVGLHGASITASKQNHPHSSLQEVAVYHLDNELTWLERHAESGANGLYTELQVLKSFEVEFDNVDLSEVLKNRLGQNSRISSQEYMQAQNSESNVQQTSLQYSSLSRIADLLDKFTQMNPKDVEAQKDALDDAQAYYDEAKIAFDHHMNFVQAKIELVKQSIANQPNHPEKQAIDNIVNRFQSVEKDYQKILNNALKTQMQIIQTLRSDAKDQNPFESENDTSPPTMHGH